MTDKDESIFLKVFGNSPKMKILDFLLTWQGFDYSLTEVAEKTCVSYPIVAIVISEFLKMGLIKETRKIGKSRLFKLSEDNELAKKLLKLQFSMAENPIMIDKEECDIGKIAA